MTEMPTPDTVRWRAERAEILDYIIENMQPAAFNGEPLLKWVKALVRERDAAVEERDRLREKLSGPLHPLQGADLSKGEEEP